MLKLNSIEVTYLNVIRVLHGVSMAVEDGAIIALLGANGAGKSLPLKRYRACFTSKRAM